MKRVAALIAAVIFTSTSSQAQPATESVPTVVVMFVDLTSSIASDAAIDEIADNAKKALRSIPPNSQITVSVWPVDKASSVKPLIEVSVPEPQTAKQRQLSQRLLNQRGEELFKAIHKRRELYVAPDRRNEPRSCLIRTLKTASEIFERERNYHPNARCELVYLSDMVEECDDLFCGTPPCGTSLTIKNYRKTLDVVSHYEPGFSLSYANLTVVTAIEDAPDKPGQTRQEYKSRGKDPEDQYVNVDSRKQFWREVFRKVGFSDKKIKNSGFLSTLPGDFLRQGEP